MCRNVNLPLKLKMEMKLEPNRASFINNVITKIL